MVSPYILTAIAEINKKDYLFVRKPRRIIRDSRFEIRDSISEIRNSRFENKYLKQPIKRKLLN